MNKHNKIIYFDKETINNILQESNQGDKIMQTSLMSTVKGTGEVAVEAKVKLEVPLLKRLSFLFSGELSTSFIKQLDKKTTISSTEISEFMKIKDDLELFKNVQVNDVENSSTFFRVAGGYLNMVKGDIDGVDVKEFNSVMESFEGYDTYRIMGNVYVRFNNSAFLSNYKRNDLLTTKLNIFCIPVGTFLSSDFDFIHQLNKMENLMTGIERTKTLADLYPPVTNDLKVNDKKIIDVAKNEKVNDEKKEKITNRISNDTIELYDVLYASIYRGVKDE